MEEVQRVPSPEHQQLFDDTVRRVIDHGGLGAGLRGPELAAFLKEHLRMFQEARKTLSGAMSDAEKYACAESYLARFKKPIKHEEKTPDVPRPS